MEKVEDLRNIFLRAINQGVVAHKKDVERVKTDTKWLLMLLETSGSNVWRAFILLKEACGVRLDEGVNDLVFDEYHDVFHSHILKPHGTDKDGCILLLYNTLKIRTFFLHHLLFGLKKPVEENVRDSLMYWFEKLYFQDDIKKFSIAIYSDILIDFEKLAILLEAINIQSVFYPGCVQTLFIFEDYLNPHAKLNAKLISALGPIFIKKSNMHEYLTMNLEELEEEQMSSINYGMPGAAGKLGTKFAEPDLPKTAGISNQANVADPGSSMDAGVEDSSVALETKEKANNLDLTLVMKKLVDVQLQVNTLVQEVLKEN